MARVVKEKEYAQRRSQIVEAAQRFMYTKGYELMSIQDILDDIKISKGAFYHYFDSKQDLLQAVVEKMRQEVEPMILEAINAPGVPALEKLERFFQTSGRWKTERKDFVLALMKVWYADENALVREKMQTEMLKSFGPMLSNVVRQGVQEGVFTTAYPEQASEIIFALILSLGDTFIDLLLNREPQPDDFDRAQVAVAAYTDALERVLGAPQGSLELMDAQTIQEWVRIPA